jgi:hypothetical protein
MKKTIQKKASFEAFDEQGAMEVLDVYVEIIEIMGVEGRTSTEGLQSIRTAAGQDVDRLDRGKFRVRPAGRILRCDPNEPNAP